MKKILTIILAIVVAGATVAMAKKKKADDGRQPAIEFVETVYDFGNIPELGGNVSHDFVFTNTGTAPLAIMSANATCGCTKPKYPTSPVAPGKGGKVKVTYVPDHRPGEFEKTVTVVTNVPGKQKRTVLKIKGFVIPAKSK